MYEKILALLSAKFAQARKDGLQQMARVLSLQAGDESEIQALVDKLTAEQVTDFIKHYRREVDAEVTGANKTFEANLKSKYDFVEKTTPASTPRASSKETQEAQAGNGSSDDVARIIQQSVEAAIKPLQEKIQSFEHGKTLSTRKQTLEGKLKEAPQSFKNTILKSFEKMQFESDEEFEAFVAETESDLKEFSQEAANTGLGGFPKPGSSSSADVSKDKAISDIQKWAGTDKKS